MMFTDVLIYTYGLTQMIEIRPRKRTTTSLRPRSSTCFLFIYVYTNMSETLYCFDCERSITFLHVGGSSRLVRIPSRDYNTIIYVRCYACINTFGKLDKGEHLIAYANEQPYVDSITKIRMNIASFMNVDVMTIMSVSDDPILENGLRIYTNVNEALERYMYKLARLSLDTGEPAKAYDDFYASSDMDALANKYGSPHVPMNERINPFAEMITKSTQNAKVYRERNTSGDGLKKAPNDANNSTGMNTKLDALMEVMSITPLPTDSTEFDLV